MTKRKTASEHSEQVVVIEWAWRCEYRYPELRWLYAVVNGAKLPYKKTRYGRYSREAQWLKAEGLRPGISDLCLPYAKGVYHALYIEMKYGSNTPTESQLEFIEAMIKARNFAVICRGADEAIWVLERYLNLKEGEVIDDFMGKYYS